MLIKEHHRQKVSSKGDAIVLYLKVCFTPFRAAPSTRHPEKIWLSLRMPCLAFYCPAMPCPVLMCYGLS